jgi:ELWxxDGT repeat protein
MPGIHGTTTGYSQSIGGGGGDDTLTSAFGGATLDGGGGNDSLVAAGYGNQLLGGLGDDQLDGGLGNATLVGGDGNNWLHVAGYNDSISAGTGNNTVSGTDGNATILLGTGSNQVTVSGWGNSVTTGDGPDSIALIGGGNATISTGGGDDLVALGTGGGDSVDAGAGFDTITYSGAAGSYTVHANGNGTTSVSGPGGTDTLRGVETLQFAGGGADLHPGSPVPPGGGTPAPTPNLMLFTANDGTHGIELWASDGTATGTWLVTDLTPGAASSSILGLTGLGNAAVFATQQLFQPGPGEPGHAEITLWHTDGSATGTWQLTTLTLGYANPMGWQGGFTALSNGHAIFEANAAANDLRYFGLDLTGTAPLALGDAWSGTTPVVIDGSKAFWVNQIGGQVTVSDGTLAGTVTFAGDGTGSAAGLGNGKLVYAGASALSSNVLSNTQLYVYDTITGGAPQVITLNASGSAQVSDLTSFGYGHALFAADDGSHGRELWITDGTAGGTHMVADLWAGAFGSDVANITDLGNGRAIASAQVAPFDQVLVLTDGTAAGTQVRHQPGYVGQSISLGNGLGLFLEFDYTTDPLHGSLWVTDGTASGTHALLAGSEWVSGAGGPHDLHAIGNGLAMFAFGDFPTSGDPYQSPHGDELWVTDGTLAGTHMVKDINPGTNYSSPTEFTAIHLVPPAPLAGSGWGQTLTGTPGADTITDSFGGATITGNAGDDSITLGGGHNQVDAGAGNDTVITTGWGDSLSGGTGNDSLSATGGGGTLDGGAGDDSLSAGGWGNSIFGGAGNDRISLSGGGGDSIDAGDGADWIYLGLGGGNTVDAGAGADTVAYGDAAGHYTLHGNADGSLDVMGPGGTDHLSHVEVLHFGSGVDVNVGAFLANGGATPAAANEVLFLANDGSHGVELWASDLGGSTHLVKDLTPGSAGSSLLGLASMGSKAIFATMDVVAPGPGGLGGTTFSIWESDGTAAGTAVVTTLSLPGPWTDAFFVEGLVPVGNGKAVFSVGITHAEVTLAYVVSLDGSAPVQLAGNTFLGNITAVAGNHVAWNDASFGGGEIGYTDGTPGGTHAAGTYVTGSVGIASLGNGKLVYGASHSLAQGVQLEVLDTATGIASQVKVINPTGSADISDITSFGYGHALFAADDGVHGKELWITDGSAAGTMLLADLYVTPSSAGSYPYAITDLGNGHALFAAQSTGNPIGGSIGVTDGTPAGTHAIASWMYISSIISLGNGLAVFANADSFVGSNVELWVSDGSLAGTHRITEIAAGSASSSPHDIVALGDGRAVFTANDGIHGDEMWITDGTAGGTHLLADIQAGAGSAVPHSYVGIHYTAPVPLVATGYGQALGGTGGNDTMTSSFGGATLDGGAGNDSIVAAGWGNHLIGGPGDDTLDGGAGNSTLEAGDGNNLVLAAGWSDSITSGSGDDHITLSNGGNATIASGGGQDSIALGQGGGDVVDAGGGNDTVSYSGNAVDYHIQRNADGSLTLSGPGGTDQLSHVERVQFANGHFDPATPTHGDLTGDHRADPVLQNVNGDVWTLPSTGGASEIFFDHQGFVAKFLGDIRGDGGTEILYQNPADGWLWLQQTTGGAPLSQGGPGSFGVNQRAVGLADFNGDGRDEILLRDATNGAISLEQVNPDYSGTPLQAVGNPGLGWSVVGTGDLSGDGRADILFHNTGGGYWLWQMNGAAIGPQGAIADPGGTWQVKAIADVNGDNHADLIWQDAAGNLDIWEMSGTTVLATGYLGSTGSWWTLIGAEDLTGDGRADLIFQGQDGTLWDWTLNGMQVTGGGSLAAPGAGWHLVG